ncbi:MAG TPA: YdiU family protein [Patescibacteria group bacterium]|nr:YdiU family protein [Patescibacteria group bacterium]
MTAEISQTQDTGWRFETSYLGLPEAFFTRQPPVPVKEPRLVLWNAPLAETLGLRLAAADTTALARIFAGNELPAGATPLAQAYGGHQYGHFTMLGDGRAVLLGEHIAPDGARFDIQLKGSGRTPYSRGGDGRAALGPMLREYIISEAMAGLGIPTTRSLAVVATGELVAREGMLPGAVLTRVAASHIRVGTFEFAAGFLGPEGVRALADYTIARHYPGLRDADNPYLAFLEAVVARQADLIARWMLVGFIHGVMNTDNMAISGETIDYGPCAFMDAYDPNTVFSSIDRHGRYAYGQQPPIATWNLARFAETLLTLIDSDEKKAVAKAETAVNDFDAVVQRHWLAGMRGKLGLTGEDAGDEGLISALLIWMAKEKADFTLTFHRLADGSADDATGGEGWVARWRARRDAQGDAAKSAALMRSHNPQVIPRNHKVEEALAAANRGELAPLHQLLDALRDPYAPRGDRTGYETPPPERDACYRTYCGT